ncbi:MAG: hypothetical protein M0R80_13250 [Proteobacteria bacterium]|jgi:hypothetical protein|nr:hypothetical protein [Pseudomonadota bacterium]
MISKIELQEAIINRVEHIAGSCNSFNINRNEGVVIGLLWALTGKKLDTLPNTTAEIFDLANIKYTKEGDKIRWVIN